MSNWKLFHKMVCSAVGFIGIFSKSRRQKKTWLLPVAKDEEKISGKYVTKLILPIVNCSGLPKFVFSSTSSLFCVIIYILKASYSNVKKKICHLWILWSYVSGHGMLWSISRNTNQQISLMVAVELPGECWSILSGSLKKWNWYKYNWTNIWNAEEQ